MGNSKSTISKTNKEARGRQRIDIQKIQNVLLIWLDANIDDNNEDTQNTITRLRSIVNDVNTYTDDDQCIQFIKRIKDRKACMIISGSLGQHIVPQIHGMSQMDSIFIFCGNKQRHEAWTKEWPKIKGVFTEIIPMCEALKQAVQKCEQNAISISFVGSGKKLNQLDPSFMYTQILKEILLTIKFDATHIQEFVSYCPEALADNGEELNNIQQLASKYYQQRPIWWYTKESVLYPMLNRALREMNGDIMTRMGFFISDLHRHIESVHQEQHMDKIFTVFRGQGLSKTDFEQLKQTKGGLLSFNNFLSTSKIRDISLGFARSAASNPDLVGILFVMTIDPRQSTTAFASIGGISYFSKEDEVLFSMHSVFRIQDIKLMGGNNELFEVSLILTSDNDKELHALTERIREESFPDVEGWYRLGLVLKDMGQNDKAQEIYEILLDQTTKESEKAAIYNQLGSIKDNQGEYKEAIRFYEKSLAIYEKTLSPQHPELAKSYNNIGGVYDNMGDYPKALSSHEKALAIKQQSLPPNHLDLAMSYNNIGLVYKNMGDYPKALSSHEKALAIKQQSLPPNHPDLASSYGNIGLVYSNMGAYPKALSCFEKVLAIQQQSLPPNHPHLASTYNNIGLVYDNMGDHPKALSSHEKALAIKQQSLPPNHPHLAKSYNNIGALYIQMNDYPKALSCFENVLAIQQQSLPPNHPDLASPYNNIGLVYDNMSDYPKALSFYEKALAIRQQSLPPNHPDLAASYGNIGLVYSKIGDYPEALSYYEKALAILQQSLLPNHPHLASTYNNIGLVYDNMGDYSKACSFYERAVQIAQESLPSDHLRSQQWKNNYERVKKKL